MGPHEDRFRDLTLKQYEEVWNNENYDYARQTVHRGSTTIRRRASSTSAASAPRR